MSKRVLSLVALCVLPLAALGQAGSPARAGSTEATSQASPSGTPEPAVRRTVIEDEGTRIEELRVRGAVRNITVRPKGALSAPYEVLAPDAGRDTSSGPNSSKGSAGQSVWRVLNF